MSFSNLPGTATSVTTQEYFFSGKQKRWDHAEQVKKWKEVGLAPNVTDYGSVIITYATPTEREKELVKQSGVFVNENIAAFRTASNWMIAIPPTDNAKDYHTTRSTMSVHHELVEKILEQAAIFEKEHGLLRTDSFNEQTGEPIPGVAYVFNEQTVGCYALSAKNLGRAHFCLGKSVNYKGVHWSVVDQPNGASNGVCVNYADHVFMSKNKVCRATLSDDAAGMAHLRTEFLLQQSDLINCRPTSIIAPADVFDAEQIVQSPATKQRRFFEFC